MSIPSNNFRNTAVRLINRYGQDSTYQKFTAGVYDPSTGTVSETAGAITPLKAYFQPLSTQEARNPALVGVDAVEAWVAYGDLPEVPKIGSLVSSQGLSYEVLTFKSHNYSAGVACWVLICKQG